MYDMMIGKNRNHCPIIRNVLVEVKSVMHTIITLSEHFSTG